MAFSSIDTIVAALSSAQQLVVNKASIASQVAGGYCSMWRATGIPAQAAIPATAAACTRLTMGAFSFANPPAGKDSALLRASFTPGNASTTVMIYDRLAHMGGLSGVVTAAQTVGVDVSGTNDNLPARRGDAAFSDVQWWLEWYTATGATAVTATVNYTNAAGISGRTTTVALSASVAAGRLLPIIGAGGEFIRSIESVTLSATTGTAGSFGVTATRFLTDVACGLANFAAPADWQALGMPQVEDDACLMLAVTCGTTSSGALYGSARLGQA